MSVDQRPPGVPPRYAVVIPTVGRVSLHVLLESLAAQRTNAEHLGPAEIIVVDDRRSRTPGDRPGTELPPLFAQGTRFLLHAEDRESSHATGPVVRVLSGHGRGPAHARNRGWRAATAEWICLLDDDVWLPAGWVTALVGDLTACADDVAATQGRVQVPLPPGRRPTDWERNTAALESARWATADMAYRREALMAVNGFDERFPRAFREDADLALRVRRAGWRLTQGDRRIVHPVRPADRWVSARVQAGNADDALMRHLHGPQWHSEAQAPRGGFAAHVATTAAGAGAVVAGAAWAAYGVLALAGADRKAHTGSPGTGRRAKAIRSSSGKARARRLAAVCGGAWAGLTLRFLLHRMAPGPAPADRRFLRELTTMTLTSAVIPPLAVAHRLTGAVRHRRTPAWPPPVRAVLFDRDGTLIDDVPYNTDPQLVRPVPGAAAAVRKAREAGLATAVVSNQSAIGRKLATAAQVDQVDDRVRELLGPFDGWRRCPHAPEDGCGCRKPAPGMVLDVARTLGVQPEECVLIGDIGADVEAAAAAGARAILVPTPATRPGEVADAPWVAGDLGGAVDLALAMARLGTDDDQARPYPGVPS